MSDAFATASMFEASVCGDRAVGDVCTLSCMAAFGGQSEQYICNGNGEWEPTHQTRLQCSNGLHAFTAVVGRVYALPVGELFLL